MGIEIFTEKYRPKNIKQFVGNEQAVKVTKQFFISWNKGEPINKCLLYYGPPGTGKTTLALLLALNTGQDVIHHNASDLSRKEDMERLRHTSKLGTFDVDKMRIVIVDECDRIGKKAQKGLLKAMKETKQPMILICNDVTKIVYEVKRAALGIQFDLVPEYLIKRHLLHICATEGEGIAEDALRLILKHNRSVRGAVNALQEYLQCGEVAECSRDLDLTNIDKMRYILNGYQQDIRMPLEDITKWFTDSELEDYEVVSMLDVINRRVRDSQNYDLWDYGYGIVNTARGNLCDYPVSFKNISANRKGGTAKEEETRDEHIRFGKNRKRNKPKDDGSIKLQQQADEKEQGFGDFL